MQLSTPEHAADLRLNVVLFSGGSGTGTITEALLRHPQLMPILIINAYDDGHSTGRLRKFIPGMLGPSDVRKNINRLMPRTEERHAALRFLSDHRLPKKYPFADGMNLVRAIAEGNERLLPADLAARFDVLSVRQSRTFRQYFEDFFRYADREAVHNNFFDFDDCALGNILFGGCFLGEDRDFNRAIKAFSDFFELDGRILNVTRGENLFLMARTEDGQLIRGEAQLVSLENASPIRDIYLIDEAIYRKYIEPADHVPDAELEKYVEMGRRLPEINPEAKKAITSADIIIYGPGTQHSSLLPSYLTRGVAEAIRSNTNVDKVFISNIRRDVDIQQEDANALADKFLAAMGRYGELSVETHDVASHFFFQKGQADGHAKQAYVPFDESALRVPLSSVLLRDWETRDGQHAGGYVMQELRRLIQNRIGASLDASRYMVSIVVPALNEQKTVEECLRRLTALDFVSFDLGKEVLFVDGGSTDQTFEIASSVPGVKTFRLEKQAGRGAALKHGIEKARGDVIIFFPADLEYSEEDVYNLVFSIVRNNFKIVFGTRTVKCTDLDTHLLKIYGGKRIPYLVSKYGGMLLSTATLFLYNRYVTDTLTSLKGFDGKVLRSLDLRSNGMDLDTEIVAKACRSGQYILEVPVEYQARTKAQGKKSTALQGLKALWALFSWRYTSLS